jgi:hypothetical protein
VTVRVDEETIYLRKIVKFLKELPELARWSPRVIAAGSLEKALQIKFKESAIILHDFEPEVVDSHNTIRDWYYRHYLTTIIKRSGIPARSSSHGLPSILAGEADAVSASVAVFDGILREAFRGENLSGYCMLINFSFVQNDSVLSTIEGIDIESRTYQIETIKEVDL